jgi:transketolase
MRWQRFGDGFYHATKNAKSRTLSVGGICEDAMCGILSGISSWGEHIGVGSSYGAFLALLCHIAMRLHAIGNHARKEHFGSANTPVILICAHTGLKPGEDGPTHANLQPLQLLQENFFKMNRHHTYTMGSPRDLDADRGGVCGGPSVIAPFVTRPPEKVLDRKSLGLAPASAARTGVYCLKAAKGKSQGTVVLQESGVTYASIEQTLPLLEKAAIDINVYYVASAELFDTLSPTERERTFPTEDAKVAMGITGLTLPTMNRWISSERGQAHTLHPFQKGHFLGRGPGHKVFAILNSCESGAKPYESVDCAGS